MTNRANSQKRAEVALAKLGFRLAGSGFQRGVLNVQEVGAWLEIRSKTSAMCDAGQDWLGRPGLWKPSWNQLDSAVFEIPQAALSGAAITTAWDSDRDPEEALLEKLIGWAVATATHELPPDWQPPTSDELAEWLGPQALCIQCGPFARQGTVVREPGRLALGLPLAAEISPQLSAARRVRLAQVLEHAQSRWRMARAGCGADAVPRLEVDLTGVPAEVCEPIVYCALASLRAVGNQLLETISLLCDPSVECSVWDGEPDGVL
jgi:hypothetical protein